MPNKAETFARSETHINLMRAFAGESQARNRYTIAAGMAREKTCTWSSRPFCSPQTRS